MKTGRFGNVSLRSLHFFQEPSKLKLPFHRFVNQAVFFIEYENASEAPFIKKLPNMRVYLRCSKYAAIKNVCIALRTYIPVAFGFVLFARNRSSPNNCIYLVYWAVRSTTEICFARRRRLFCNKLFRFSSETFSQSEAINQYSSR